MDVYQRAWASLLGRIEAKTSWGRNELKQAMLEALVEAGETVYLDKDGNPTQFGPTCRRCGSSTHTDCVGKQAMADRDFRTPKEVDYSASVPYADADAVQRKAQHEEFAGLMDDIPSSDINPEDLGDV